MVSREKQAVSNYTDSIEGLNYGEGRVRPIGIFKSPGPGPKASFNE